jgi:uncharacterized 2Fe-2S/4Fe-4S cluster protein (DUF4445 family)
MRESEVPVTFHPPGKPVHVLQGTGLVEAAAGAGVALDLPCGGEGVCGKCRVVVRSGAGEPNAVEQDALTVDELQQGVRLACQTSVSGPMTVEVPETSVLASYHKILAQTDATRQVAPDSAIGKHYVELPPPARGDDDADLIRLHHALGPFDVDLDLLRELPHRLREHKFRGTGV